MMKHVFCIMWLLAGSLSASLSHSECAYYSEESSPFGIESLISGHLYAVHSATHITDGQGNSTINADSNIYIIKGVADIWGFTTVWLFGSGYGDPAQSLSQPSDINGYVGSERDAYRSASSDAYDVDCVITQELSLSPDYVKLRFLTPHGHLDHVNSEFLESMTSDFDYDLMSAQFMIHAADYPYLLCDTPCCGTAPCNGTNPYFGAPYEPAFSASILSRFQTLGSPTVTGSCNILMSFQSSMGEWQIRHEASTSHTSGILYLKHNDVQSNVVTYITGAKQQFITCPLTGSYPGSQVVIYDVHRT